jgi:uncharacterized membrane protein
MTTSPVPPDEESPAPRVSLFGHLRNYFLTGIVVAAPLLITGYLLVLLIRTIDEAVHPLLPPELAPITVPGLGLIIAVVSLTLLGAVFTNVVGRWLLQWSDEVLFRIPLIKTIYKPVRQVFESLMRPGGKTFREVVLIQYPRAGSYALAFKTAPAPPSVSATMGEPAVAVFVPTSPNLYAGFLLMLPEREVTTLAMPVEEAIRLQVSAGIAGQPQPDRNRPAALSRSKR